MEKTDFIRAADSLQGLRELAPGSVQCCVTSPPYFRLRDYLVDGQLGMEESPPAYISRLLAVFNEVRRVLKDDGTLWLNLGDSYCSKAFQPRSAAAAEGKCSPASIWTAPWGPFSTTKRKEIIGMPWAVAFALREQGWWIRQEIIWAKPNPMPESVSDRCTRSHEYIFMLTKNAAYYYNADAVKTQAKACTLKRYQAATGVGKYAEGIPGIGQQAIFRPRPGKQLGHGPRHAGFNDRWRQATASGSKLARANRRSVWTIATKGFKGAHYATFPLELPQLCILAGSRAGDTILDPFCGSGTTLLAASQLGRHYIGFDINAEYVRMARRRLHGK
jgi:DNA modification methylase